MVLLCISFQRTLEFPENKADLYGHAIEALLLNWDTHRRIRRERIYQSLSTRRKINLLSQIAYRTFSKGNYFVPKRMLETYIEEFMQNIQADDENSEMPLSKVILEAIEAHHGLLIKQTQNVYSFSHLTVQEYFTARYIMDYQHRNTIEELIKNRLHDNDWFQVFVLTVAMSPEPEYLFLSMRKQISLLSTGIESYMDEIFQKARPSIYCPLSLANALAICTVYSRSLDLEPEFRGVLSDNPIQFGNLLSTLVDLAERLDHSRADIYRLAFQITGSLGTIYGLTSEQTFSIITSHPLDRIFGNILTLGTSFMEAIYRDKGDDVVILFSRELKRMMEYAQAVISDFYIYLKANLTLLECLNTDFLLARPDYKWDMIDGLLSETYE